MKFFKRTWFSRVVIWILAGIVITGCSPDKHPDEVALYDTQGFADPAHWKRITSLDYVFTNPEQIVFENGVFRVTYPMLRTDQRAGHSYWVKIGAEWHRVTDPEYGDYVYFIDSIRYPPEEITILKNTLEEVEIAFRYYHKNYRAATSWKSIYKGDIALTKIMALKKGYPGVFVKLESLPENPFGEREIGFGISAPVIYGDTMVSIHPAPDHVPLDMHEARWYYAVSLPVNNSFYRMIALSRPMITLAFQPKDLTKGARLIVNYLIEHEADRYQVFLGAQPYDSSQAMLEVEAQLAPESVVPDQEASDGQVVRLTADTTQRQRLTIIAPVTGEYRLVLRGRSAAGGRLRLQIDKEPAILFEIPENDAFEYYNVSEWQALSAGKHRLAIVCENGEFDIDTVLVLPIRSPAKNFPLDVFGRVFPELILAQSRFEAEHLHHNTGEIVTDAEASQNFAILARTGVDQSDLMTFGPYQRVLEPGHYVARFFLKVRDHTTAEAVAVLDVHAPEAGVMAQKIVKGTDFQKSLAYQAFDLELPTYGTDPPTIQRLEFRVLFNGVTDVWVDCIDLVQAPASGTE